MSKPYKLPCRSADKYGKEGEAIAAGMLGHLPNANDSFLFDGHVITVLEVVNMRVEKVRVEARKNAD